MPSMTDENTNNLIQLQSHTETPPCNLCGSTRSEQIMVGRDRLLKLEGTFIVVRCQECGLIFTSPRPKGPLLDYYYPKTDYHPYQESRQLVIGKIQRLVLQHHKGYDGQSSWLGRLLTWPFQERVYRFPRFVPGGKMLEVGCASGAYLAQLRELGWETYGVELNEQASQYARERFGLDVVSGDLLDANYPPDFFDVAVLWMVVEHLPDPSATFAKLQEILKPDGLLMIGIPNIESIDATLFGERWYAWDLPRHFYHFSPQTITMMLRNAGFKDVKVIHRRNVNNFVGSLRYVLEDRAPTRFSRWFLSSVNVGHKWASRLLMPFGLLTMLLKRSGRIVVQARADK